MSNCEMTYLILTSKLSRVYVAKTGTEQDLMSSDASEGYRDLIPRVHCMLL